jgi:bifunctional non-homologous end joining protein LigD
VTPVLAYRAQLATLAEKASSGEQWLHELKYDGYRIACIVEHGQVRLLSRRDRDWTESFPEIAAAARELPVESAILDGEVAIVLPDGTTSFRALQNAFSGGPRDGLTYFGIRLDADRMA